MILVKSRDDFVSLWSDPAIQEAFNNSDAFKVLFDCNSYCSFL
jgi:hypothetical protein